MNNKRYTKIARDFLAYFVRLEIDKAAVILGWQRRGCQAFYLFELFSFAQYN